jgi:hypothetical protein
MGAASGCWPIVPSYSSGTSWFRSSSAPVQLLVAQSVRLRTGTGSGRWGLTSCKLWLVRQPPISNQQRHRHKLVEPHLSQLSTNHQQSLNLVGPQSTSGRAHPSWAPGSGSEDGNEVVT